MEVLLVDESIAVLIDHVKGFFELLDLLLGKHGEDIGGGPLGAFLGHPATGGSTTRRHGRISETDTRDTSLLLSASTSTSTYATENYCDDVCARADAHYELSITSYRQWG